MVLYGPPVVGGLAIEYPLNGPWVDVGRKRYAGANRGESCLGENVPRALPKNPKSPPHSAAVYEYSIVLVEERVRFIRRYPPERVTE